MRRIVLILSSLSALVIGLVACADESLPTQTAAPLESGSPALVVIPSVAPSDANATFFGPETFTRSRGKPSAETREISVTGYGAPYTLHLQNGDAGGGARVSSARVSLNGQPLFRPSDFSQEVTGHTRTVELNDPSVLSVELASAPGSQLSIWIEGTRLPASVELTPDEVSLAAIGASLPISATVLDAAGVELAGAAVEWASSDEAVAIVDEQGMVTAVANGTAAIAATSGAASASATVTVAQVASKVEVAPGEATLTSTGATAEFAATVRDAGGTEISGATVTWTSSDEAVATVDAVGVVTAIAGGSAGITATSGSASEVASVTVELVAASVSVTPAAATLSSLGATQALAADVRDAADTQIPEAPVSWTSSDESVAIVSETGVVEAIANGTATITAESGGASGTATIEVAQIAAQIEVVPGSVELGYVGATAALSAIVRDAGGSELEDAPVTWSSSSTSVDVSEAGVVTANAGGSATITATSGAASGTGSVIVDQIPASITVDPASAELAPGETSQFTATVRDQSSAVIPGAGVTWNTNDPNVATVDGNGRVTAIAGGTTEISATSGSVTATSQVTVGGVPTTVEISPASVMLTSLGDFAQLSATVRDGSGAEMEGVPVDWSSSDPSIVEVDAGGKITAKAVGDVTITATSGTAAGTADVRAIQVAFLITMNPPSADMAPGDQVQFTATIYDERGSIIPDAPRFWNTTTPGVATVTSSGLATAVAPGIATIYVSSGPATGNAHVTVGQTPQQVTVSPGSSTVTLGQKAFLTASALDTNNQEIEGAVVNWTTSNAGVAMVTPRGKVETIGPGTATITASSPGATSGTAQITVVAQFTGATITSAALSQTVLAINSSAATQFPVTIANPTGATIPSVVVQTRIVQGSHFDDTGGRQVTCGGAAGELPPSTCTTIGSVHASNSEFDDVGSFVPGSAVLHVFLVRRGSGEQLSPTVSIPITLQ